MKRTFWIIGIVVAVLVVLGLGGVAGVAMAQSGETPAGETGMPFGMFGQRMHTDGGMMGDHGQMGMRGGMRGGMTHEGMDSGKMAEMHGSMGMKGEGPLAEYMHAALAEALGMSVEEFQALHDAGDTFFEIAEAQGLTAEEAQALMVEVRADALAAAVEAGTITQEQADGMSARMGQMGGKHQGDCPMAPETTTP